MEQLINFFLTIIDSQEIIKYGGVTLLLLIVFAENGLIIGFFLPGDYLLFIAGMLCGTEHLDVPIYNLVLYVMLAAIIGYYLGYFKGKFIGKKLYNKKDTFLFKQKYIEQTKIYYSKYGNITLIIGRFLPIIRTFSPMLAGVASMEFKIFTVCNIAGALLWVGLLVPGGYILSQYFPELIHYIHYIIIGFILITTFVLIRSFFKLKNIKT